MDAQGLLDYFAPLQRWLEDQVRAAPKVGDRSPRPGAPGCRAKS